MPVVAPSILAANFANLEAEINLVNESNADWLHVDIMDGVFVPNISFGQNIVKTIHKYSTKPLDVHLMIVNPDRYIRDFADAGASIITVHLEACDHLHRTVQLIKEQGVKAGVAINPHTQIDLLDDILEDIDLALVMSVNPGFGGQKFIDRSLYKISRLKEQIMQRNLKIVVEVDGGVNLKNAESIVQAGVDVLVAGSTVFKSEVPIETIKALKSLKGKHTFQV